MYLPQRKWLIVIDIYSLVQHCKNPFLVGKENVSGIDISKKNYCFTNRKLLRFSPALTSSR